MKRLSWLYILLMLVGCTESSIEDNSVIATGSEEFYATIEGMDSRTYVDGQIRMRWHADDRITIFKKETYNREFKFTGKTGANAGGFKQVSVDDDFYFSYPVNANYAVYPHSTDTELDETDCFFTLTMPAEQTYAENSFGLNANTMVAVSETGNLMFKNVGCYLRVRLYGENTTISSVTLTTKGDEAIAGEAKVTPSMDGNPTCEMKGTGKSIRLICETPVAISSNADTPTDFWIVVPPVTLADGFSVTVENENGNTQVYDVNQSFTFERNKYYDMVRKVEIEDIKTVHVATAGTLPTLISEDEKYNITSIKITGDLNGTDFKFIRDMAGHDFNFNITEGKLVYLDLSDANIVEGGETYFDDGFDKFITKNNTLTTFIFFGSRLTKIVIPNSVTTIEGTAFYACSIKSITIPKNVTKLFYNSFGGCINLTEIIVDPENTVYDSRNNCNAIIETETNTLIVGINDSFIPEGVTSIGSYAFNGCTALSSVTIPNSVTSIGSNAFYGCSSLTSITIPNSVTSIGSCAFGDCSSLTSITIPNSVTSIGSNAFMGCSSLTSITIPNSVTSIGSNAFGYRSSMSVYISDLSAWCRIDFEGICSYRPFNLYLNGNLLTELVIPEDIVEIKKCTFSECSSLTSITIPNSVTSIGSSAFYNCSSLTSITIPNSVTSIGSHAFDSCSSLTSVYISDLSAWCRIEFSDYGDSNPLENGSKLYLNGNLLTELVIPEDIVEIKKYTFSNYSSLTSVTIGNGVTSIEEGAFWGCDALTSVTIGNGVTSIGFGAFSGCDALTSVTIGKGVTSIDGYAFESCPSLAKFYCYATTPPNCGSKALSGIKNNATLYVPKGCKSAYESAEVWSTFTNIIEMD